jgi:hypothetical protein
MKIELTGASFLTLPELGELAARLDALHQKTVKTIDRLESEIEAQKARVAERWKGVRALGLADRSRPRRRSAPSGRTPSRSSTASSGRPARATALSSGSAPTGPPRPSC